MADLFNRLKNFSFDSLGVGNIRSAGSSGGGNSSSKSSGPDMVNKADQFRDDFVKGSASSIQDPLYLTFGLNFNFFERIGESESLLPGLLSGAARQYLNGRGDTQRVLKLDYFVSMLRRITIDEPWYIQSLNGLDGLMNIDLTKGMRSENRQRITITTLETIDMKVMSMIDAYRSVTIDKKFMRSILPENLKRFDLTVYAIDPRIIVKRENGGFGVDPDTQGVISLKLFDCEFHFENFGSFIGNLDNAEIGSPRSHTFEISVGRIYDTYNLPTSYLYGYGGSGYSSDDQNQDYNFLANVLRSNSTNFAEVGNERRVNYKGSQIKQSKKPGITNVGEPNDNPATSDLTSPTELERESQTVNNNPTELGTLNRQSNTTNTNTDLPNQNPISQPSSTELTNTQLDRESLRTIIDN